MKTYIYIFEDGEIGQSGFKPTETDKEKVDQGTLQVLVIDYENEGIYHWERLVDVKEADLLDQGFHLIIN